MECVAGAAEVVAEAFVAEAFVAGAADFVAEDAVSVVAVVVAASVLAVSVSVLAVSVSVLAVSVLVLFSYFGVSEKNSYFMNRKCPLHGHVQQEALLFGNIRIYISLDFENCPAPAP
nr:hypothetical protein [Neobacillus rhizosphaerae]